jgi:Helix-hairpin-helix motif
LVPPQAEKILQARKSYGRFKNVDDLQAVRGIGPKRLEKMRKYLTVDAPRRNRKAAAIGVFSERAGRETFAGQASDCSAEASGYHGRRRRALL